MKLSIKQRLEYLRGEIVAERISTGEIAELQGLADQIDPSDTLLLEWAGVPEFPESGNASYLVITIDTDNEAFQDHAEIETARILHQLADDLLSGKIDSDGGKLHDINGNTCGSIELEV